MVDTNFKLGEEAGLFRFEGLGFEFGGVPKLEGV